MTRRLLILFFLCVLSLVSFAQRHVFGIQAQLLLSVGTPVNRIGINLNGFWLTSFSQVNIGTQSSFYLTGIGPKGNFIENRTHISLIGLAGKRNGEIRTFVNPLFHQSQRSVAFGYSFLWYWDNRKTAQLSGRFGLQFQRVALQFENDLFGGQGRDRFRTAGLHAFYMDSLNSIGAHIRLWTGETRGGIRHTDANYPSKYGYKDLSQTLYGKYSSGIASISYSRLLPFSQQLGAEIGIDAEQIRHFFQNKLVHDFTFSKKNTRKHNPHYPMLQEDGSPYIFVEGTKPRKARFVGLFTIGGN